MTDATYSLGIDFGTNSVRTIVVGTRDGEELATAVYNYATGVDGIPSASVLYGNHPNPFTPATSISFAIPASERVRVSVFDIRGRLVRTLVDDVLEAGPHDLPWNGTNQWNEPVGSGVYFYRLESDGVAQLRSMVLLR